MLGKEHLGAIIALLQRRRHCPWPIAHSRTVYHMEAVIENVPSLISDGGSNNNPINQSIGLTCGRPLLALHPDQCRLPDIKVVAMVILQWHAATKSSKDWLQADNHDCEALLLLGDQEVATFIAMCPIIRGHKAHRKMTTGSDHCPALPKR